MSESGTNDDDIAALEFCKQHSKNLDTPAFNGAFCSSFNVRRGIICGTLDLSGRKLRPEERNRKGLPFSVARTEFPYLLRTNMVCITSINACERVWSC